MYLVSSSAKKKNAEASKFLGILKKDTSPRIKYIFVWKRKAMCHLIKTLFCLSQDFQTWFHNADHLLYYPQMSILFSYFFCSLISVSKKRSIETILALPYSYNWQKFNNKTNGKRSQEYQTMDPGYVIGQINSRILEPLRQFRRLIFGPSRKS